MIPFILRFAQQIPLINPEVLRYDPDRQIAQVQERGNWIDRLAAGVQEASTKITRMNNETTDDE
jgi:hypothetical protein